MLLGYIKHLFYSTNNQKIYKSKEERTPALQHISEQLIPLKELEQYIKGKVTEHGDLRDDTKMLKALEKNLIQKEMN